MALRTYIQCSVKGLAQNCSSVNACHLNEHTCKFHKCRDLVVLSIPLSPVTRMLCGSSIITYCVEWRNESRQKLKTKKNCAEPLHDTELVADHKDLYTGYPTSLILPPFGSGLILDGNIINL